MFPGDENDPHRYDDLLDLPHHVSPTRPRMPAIDRAAQFAPFAALTDFGEAIEETRRETERRFEPGESEQAELAEKLRVVEARIRERPVLTVTYFAPDARKEGGRYVTVRGAAKRISPAEYALVLEDGQTIDLDDIVQIDGKVFEGMVF